jgi:hypothetical protein
MSRDIGRSNQRAAGHISVSIPTRDAARIAGIKLCRCEKIIGDCVD